tara:strand:- start:1662 stop:2135 length:474 start_codon:yes stop_codon:yes gene_type:complete
MVTTNEMIKSISFGLNEQLLMISAMLAGLIGSSKTTIIYTLILISLSNSLPDTISYYQNVYQDTKDEYESVKISSYVLMTELLTSVIVLLPIILIDKPKVAIPVTYCIICVMSILNLHYLIGYDIKETTKQFVIYIFIVGLIYFISKESKSYFKINI